MNRCNYIIHSGDANFKNVSIWTEVGKMKERVRSSHLLPTLVRGFHLVKRSERIFIPVCNLEKLHGEEKFRQIEYTHNREKEVQRIIATLRKQKLSVVLYFNMTDLFL